MTTGKQKTSDMPVAKRTRLQLALRNELGDKSEEEAIVVSEEEYNRRVSEWKAREICENSRVQNQRVSVDDLVGDEDYIQFLRENESPEDTVAEISSEAEKTEVIGGSSTEILTENQTEDLTEVLGGSENDNINETEIIGGSDNESIVSTEILSGSENENI